ncbi:PqqD family peptide modification chaperone [Clostridium rectalis]|uniref:PqqD family peptide maturation chaperone WgkC n=1 Tax=Clostridium rectalis TaxID=2040295 RepID=UPI000F62D675|nr:PqqD family peptide modification chaperone [Clostridium rectalis]
MDEITAFYIEGEKTLIFRKEGKFFISFDPIDLEFVKINMIGSEMLYLISQKYKFDKIINHFTNKYNIPEKSIYNDLINFLKSYRCLNIIYDILINLSFPTEVIPNDVKI